MQQSMQHSIYGVLTISNMAMIASMHHQPNRLGQPELSQLLALIVKNIPD